VSRSLTFGGVQGMCGVVANALHDSKPFRLTLSEQYSVARRQELGALYKPEGDKSPIASSNERAVYVDHSTSLADGPHVEHGLVSRLDRSCMRENQDYIHVNNHHPCT
jgi:hypothetical protein